MIHTPHDRRAFLHLGLTLTGAMLLSGCGGDDDGDAIARVSDPVAVVPGAGTTGGGTSGTAGITGSATMGANMALTLAYIGAQYYGYAARGTGVPATMTGGVGEAGAVVGTRQARFVDPDLAGYAIQLADDKLAHVDALRQQLGSEAAAQPTIDLSPTGAFAQAIRIATPGAAFDPYADDGDFLIGAFLVENMVAATYRTLLAGTADPAAAAPIAAHLADAIYHGGLIRTLIDDRAAADPAMAAKVAAIAQALVVIDGTANASAQAATGIAANVVDASGRPIPFLRDETQVLRGLSLSAGGAGGFLPTGANGLN